MENTKIDQFLQNISFACHLLLNRAIIIFGSAL